jgi:hypothetical protein
MRSERVAFFLWVCLGAVSLRKGEIIRKKKVRARNVIVLYNIRLCGFQVNFASRGIVKNPSNDKKLIGAGVTVGL